MKNLIKNIVKYGKDIKYYAQVVIYVIDMLDGVQDINKTFNPSQGKKASK